MNIKISVVYVDSTTEEIHSPLGLTNSKALARMVACERCDVKGVDIISEDTGEVLWQGQVAYWRNGGKYIEETYDPYYNY
jgi:hypothetical protein